MPMFHASVAEMKKLLQGLSRWLEKAEANAKERGYDPNVLASARLAPDQYPLPRQVQAACDAAKFAAARGAGKDAPSHPDTEQTLEQLKARIQKVVDYLDTFSAKDFDGAEARRVALPFLEGKDMAASDYLVEMATPNFYFHLMTAYAILRHNGVPLGKIDYIGSLTTRDKPPAAQDK